jgi:imidazolonepropionase-like amidohydrolase
MTITSDSSGRMPGGRLIRAGWLIDGTGGPVREQVTLSVSKGRIVSTTADGFERFSGWDLAEYTLLPGLVDGHLHLAISGSPDTDIRQRQLGPSPAISGICWPMAWSRYGTAGTITGMRTGMDWIIRIPL